MRPTDLSLLRLPSDVQLHPDGQRVAFVVSAPEIDDDRYRRQVWVHDGTEARPFTHGPKDHAPRWSPDGRWLAFLRAGEGEQAKSQVVVMAADGGEAATQLTDFPLGATELCWSPDSQRLAVVGIDHAGERGAVDDEDRPKRARRITGLPYRADSRGYLSDSTTGIHVVDRTADVRDGGSLRTLTADPAFRERGLAWPADDRLVFFSARHATRERDGAEALFALDPTADEPQAEQLVAPGMWGGVDHAPDGTLWLTGLPDSFAWPDNLRPFRLAADGTLDDVLVDLDRATTSYDGGRVAARADGSVVAALEDRGRNGLIAVQPDGSHEVLVDGDRVVGAFDAAPDGGRIVFTVSSPDRPAEVHALVDGEEVVLTSLNDRFLREVVVAPTVHTTFERDGVEFDLWTVLPPGNDTVPVLLNIHGGPTAQYGFGFFDEFQVYAAAGYGVVATNPRGSSGRGREWMRAVVGTWLTDAPVDMADLAAVVPAALAQHPRLDGDRRGIMGGSYGGFTTAWLIGEDTGWDSAVVERALLNWSSFVGTSDIGPYFGRMFVPAHVDDGHTDLPASGDGRADLAAASPIWKAAVTRTPTLVLHSEGDYRCPVEQADQYFALLRQAGCEAEMVRFPGESHELSRSGSPAHRVERFEAVLDWHARHLA